MSKSKEKVGAAKVIADAAKLDIEFDITTAHTLITGMAERDATGKCAKTGKDEFSLRFCAFALDTLEVNLETGIPRDTIVKGFCAELDAMRPMLAAEGNPYVDMPEVKQGEETRYVWKSHGNNVKSIAKGVCEFAGLTHDAQPAIIDVREAESFTAIKKSVEQARRFGEDADKRILREAKDALREACANLISEAIKSDDAELIAELALEVEVRTDEWKADVAAQDALELEADADTETEAEAEAEAA
jgi:hypothetical protein